MKKSNKKKEKQKAKKQKPAKKPVPKKVEAPPPKTPEQRFNEAVDAGTSMLLRRERHPNWNQVERLTTFLFAPSEEAHDDYARNIPRAPPPVPAVVNRTIAPEPAPVARRLDPEASGRGNPRPAPQSRGERPVERKTDPVRRGERDKYGNLVGTSAHQVNKVMTTRWQTAQEIMEKAGLKDNPRHGQLLYLVKKGFAERSKDKKSYRLKKGG